MAVKYQITVTESERGWGCDTWTELYDTMKEAQSRISNINSKNTEEIAPDWYMIASTDVKVIKNG
jgi:hypothetical protein